MNLQSKKIYDITKISMELQTTSIYGDVAWKIR